MSGISNRITKKSEKSNLINAHTPSREPVPCITILGFLRLFLRRQHKYVLTTQKRASDWLKFRAVFVGLLPIIREIQRFSSKGGQKCKLLCRLKNKGKRYSTLEAMLSKRQGKRRIKTCFHLFFNSLFLSRCCCARANHAIMFLKKF